jgi:AmmeMemoRadiSam system protein A
MDTFSEAEKKLMLKLAHNAIAHGLENHQMMPVPSISSDNLQKSKPCFITLYLNGQLRGCIGSLKAHRPLIEDIIHHAHAAAFGDPRFFPLTKEEFENIKIHVALLSERETIQFDSEADLIRKLRPHIDGLILTENGKTGTFLPAVWESLPDPKQFLNQLKVKAGLKEDYWSNTIKVERYTAEVIK